MKRILSFLLLPVFVLLCVNSYGGGDRGVLRIEASSVRDSSARATDFHLRGIHQLECGNNDMALALFEAALEYDSLHAPSAYRISFMLDDKERALEYAQKAESLDSSNIWYVSQTGGLLTRLGRYEEALGEFRRCRELDPSNIQTHKYVAALLHTIGQPLSAIATLDTALVRFPDDLDLLEYRGEILSEIYQPKAFIENAQRMVALAPDNARYMAILAKGHHNNGSDTLATICFKRAIELDSSDVNVLAEAAMFYESTNNTDDFLDVLNLMFASDKIRLEDKLDYFSQLTNNLPLYRRYVYVIERMLNTLRLYYSDDYRVDKHYATHLVYTGETDKALDIFKQRAKESVDSISIDAYFNIISIESYRNNIDTVELYTKEAMTRFPDDNDLPMLYASTLLKRELYDEAITVLEKRFKNIENDSLRSVYMGFIGDIAQQAGRMKQCYKAYDKALKYDENNIVVLNNYAYFLSVENRDLDKAFIMSSKVIEAEPSNPVYIDTYGWILYQLGRYKDARTYLLKAIALDENPSAEVLTHYGDTMYKLGEKTNAIIYWNKAIKAGGDEKTLRKRIEDGI